MARRMVCEWGMSELGPLAYGAKEEPVFLGRDFAQRADYSEDTAIQIDRQVSRIVQVGYERATAILTRYRPVLERMAQELLEHESMDGDEVYRLTQEMTGEEHAPTRPVPPGEGLYIGTEGPETVATPATVAAGAGGSAAGKTADVTFAPREVPAEGEESADEVEAEVAGAQRRTAQPPPAPRPVPATEKKPS